MRNGKLRHRVAVHAKTTVDDAAGQPIETWSVLANRWASIKPVSGSERTYAGRLKETTTHAIRLRWVDTLAADMRIVFGTRTFEIESVLNYMEKGVYADVLCKEST